MSAAARTLVAVLALVALIAGGIALYSRDTYTSAGSLRCGSGLVPDGTGGCSRP